MHSNTPIQTNTHKQKRTIHRTSPHIRSPVGLLLTQRNPPPLETPCYALHPSPVSHVLGNEDVTPVPQALAVERPPAYLRGTWGRVIQQTPSELYVAKLLVHVCLMGSRGRKRSGFVCQLQDLHHRRCYYCWCDYEYYQSSYVPHYDYLIIL